MVVTFTSDYSLVFSGFAATYTAVAVDTETESPDVTSTCSNTVDQDDGTIRSPRYPKKYPRLRTCTYTITAPEGSHVEIDFEGFFSIESHDSCIWDYVEVDLGDGISTDLRYEKHVFSGFTETVGYWM